MEYLKCLSSVLLIVSSVNPLPVGLRTESLPATVNPETREDSISVFVDSGASRALSQAQLRPGMTVQSYTVVLEPDVDEGTFSGEVIIRVNLHPNTVDTQANPILFHFEDLELVSVQFSLTATGNLRDVKDYDVTEDGTLQITTGEEAVSYHFLIKYKGELGELMGFHGGFKDGKNSYLAMNMHPTHARRVFPCLDEPISTPILTITIKGLDKTFVIGNTKLEEEEDENIATFKPINLGVQRWGMIAHNFKELNNPVPNHVTLHGPDVNQNLFSVSSLAISGFYEFFNTWTDKVYTSIAGNDQAGVLRIVSLPDVSTEWRSVAVTGIWEPYIVMEQNCAIKQKQDGLLHIAEAISRQWFGFTVFPSNWIHEWVFTGLGTIAAYEALRDFQKDQILFEETFVTDVIRESLYLDGYSSSLPLRASAQAFNENAIRDAVTGLMKHKAPAILHMLSNILGEKDEDEPYIKVVARAMLDTWALSALTTDNFVAAVTSHVENLGGVIPDFNIWMQNYVDQNGYALVTVLPTSNGIQLVQSRFSLGGNLEGSNYRVPITFTSSNEPNFDPENIVTLLDNNFFTQVNLPDDDAWVVVNNQGRGYYRVNYDPALWERLIRALKDPDRRKEIDSLTRASLVDDALYMARVSNTISFDLAFRVALTMEHEADYAPWKAFIKNMDFYRKRLLAAVDNDEKLDGDIYVRMIRRTIGTIEEELGFSPEANRNENDMQALTRGLVMEHACKAEYEGCIAAANDMFFGADENTVNPDIHPDLRPAVYCTMMREGGDNVVEALNKRLLEAPTMYERVVILEALACSSDIPYINELLGLTIAVDSPYNVEEKLRIFKAVAESSFENSKIALDFLIGNTAAIRQHYGGPERLEQVVFAMAENVADAGTSEAFSNWVTNRMSGLGDSTEAAERAAAMVANNLAFVNERLMEAYEWIDANDAATTAMSMLLVCLTFVIAVFNH